MHLLRQVQNFIVPALICLLVGGGWYFVLQQNQTLTQTTITAYQQTQLEIVRNLARSVDSYVSEQVKIHNRGDVTSLEQEILKRFIAPVRLLQNGDAWIYSPDYVIFDLSSDFPDEYRGKSMAQIFALQAQAGASHYEEMSEAVMNVREGVGWYIWLPDKGQEIAAWTPVQVDQFVWIIGLSTPLPEILESTGATTQIHNTIVLMTLGTVLSIGLLAIWVWSALQREQVDQALRQSEQRLRQVINLVPHFIFAKDIEGRFILVNQAMANAYQTTIEDMLGKTDEDVNPSKAEIEQFRADDMEVLRSGQTKFIREEQVTNGYGQVRLLTTTKIPFTFSGTTVPAMLGVAIDVTEQRLAEAALEEYKTRLEELVATRTAELVKINAALQTEITQHKRTEAALRKSEERLRSFLNVFPDIAFVMDEYGLYLDVLVSETSARYPNAAATLKDHYAHQVFPAEIARLFMDMVQQTLVNGAQIVEYQVAGSTGLAWFEGRTFPLPHTEGDPRTILWLARDITARKQAEEAIRKSTQQLATINEIGQLITAQLHLDAVLDTVTRNTTNLLEADTGVILLLDEATQTLTINKAYGLSDYIVNNTQDRLGESIARRVALSGKPLIINDLPHNPIFYNPAAADEGLLACAIVPLRIGDKIIGTLDVHSKRSSRIFTEEDIYLLQLLADHAAIAIENARLFNEQQHQRQIAESLRQVSIALNSSLEQKIVLDTIFEQLERVIQYDGSGLFLREGDTLLLSAGRNLPDTYIGTSIPLTSLNPTLEPFRNKQLFVVADVQQYPHWHNWPGGEKIRAWMGAPLLIQDEVIGVLTTDSFIPATYTQKDAQILQIFANQAAIAIHNARLYTSAQQEIAERKQAQEALAQARDQALAASRLKTELLAKVSHELRTPLGAIMGFAEMLEAEIYGPILPEQQQATAEIIDSTKFLNSLVNELLDQAQLESGKLKLKINAFAPKTLIEELLIKMKVLAQARGLTLTTQIASELPPTLTGDATRLQQILINLVSNAIKFTRQGTIKVVLCQPTPTHWAIQVTDTGIGIPAEAQAHIFEPFGQVDGSMTRESQGAGLGLSIVKQLTHLMGGEISLESEVGKGSTFTVMLPCQPENLPGT